MIPICHYNLVAMVTPKALLAQFEQWVEEAGKDCTITFSEKSLPIPPTSTDPSDPWWSTFSTACTEK